MRYFTSYGKYIACIVLFIFMFSVYMVAQETDITVRGRVIDAVSDEPIAGASVVVENTNDGTIADAEGYFTLTVPENGSLSVYFMGYDSRTVQVKGRQEITVRLSISENLLEETVVIGYGTAKKSELTSSISSVTAKDLNKANVTSIDQALQGNAAGVLVINTSGEPGGDVTMRIRGSSSIQGDNEPLIVVDGIPSDKSVLSSLPPGDVASVEVLKDASATAIYGSRGANGVVMITTKTGREGKTKVTVDIKQTINTPRKYLDLMTAPEHAEYENLARWAWGDNRIASFSPESISTYDLQRELIRETALRQDYSLSINGGTKKMNYYVSATYYDEKGLIKNTGSDRMSVRSKFNIQAADNLSIMLSTSLSRKSTDKVNGGSDGALLQAAMITPRKTPEGKFEDGLYVDENTGEIISTNAQLAAALNKVNKSVVFSADINALLTWNITDKLVFTSSGAFDFSNNEGYTYTPRSIYLSYNSIVNSNKAGRTTANRRQWNNFNTLTYSNEINGHSFSVMAAAEFQNTLNEGHGATARLFNTDYFVYDNLAAAAYFDAMQSSKSKNTMASFFFRGTYNYDNRYLATLTFRADGSSRFGDDRKFGYFPSVSFAWVLKNEQFLKKVDWLSNLKLRLSYGITGNDKIGQYKSMLLLDDYKISINDSPYSGMGTGSFIGNPDLQWETTYQYNAGIDASFFRNRLSLTVDGYMKQTRNLLYSYELPKSSGYSNIMSNIGAVNNIGMEIELTSRNFVGKFGWTTSLTLGFNRNRVVDLGGNDMVVLYTLNDAVMKDVTYLKVGSPLAVFMGYETSIYKNWDEVYDDSSVWLEDPMVMGAMPGMMHYQDLDKNGIIDDNDRVVLGNAEPKLNGGLTNTFSYRNFDLTIFIVGSYGGSVMNANAYRLLRFRAGGNNQMAYAGDAFRPVNTMTGDQGWSEGKYPVPTVNNNKNKALQYYNTNITNYWIEDASYLRLKSLSLAYNFPQRLINRIGMSNASLVFTGTNLLTLTRYTGYDPEMSSSQGSSNNNLGIDFSSYPAPMGFTLGLNITF